MSLRRFVAGSLDDDTSALPRDWRGSLDAMMQRISRPMIGAPAHSVALSAGRARILWLQAVGRFMNELEKALEIAARGPEVERALVEFRSPD